MRFTFPTMRWRCCSPVRFALVRQKARTPYATRASSSTGRRRIASSLVSTIQPARPARSSQTVSGTTSSACGPYTERIVWTTKPSARSASGIRWWPRLRSTKDSGGSRGGRERGTNDVFHVLGLQIEVPNDRGQRLAGPEAVQHVLHACAASHEHRLAKCPLGVDLDDVPRGDRQDHPLRPIVLRV